ncbi:hypothetical protein EPO04_03330 [Patescibacteria group bacterium]|nr:MAG: hypothetical protein EPO04_03330 [Patescibacteria group bacterium]
MKTLQLANIRQYLLYGILLTLPLERIPSVSVGANGTTIRISQLLGLALILLSTKLLWSSRAKLMQLPWVFLVLFNVVVVISAAVSQHPKESLTIAAFIGFVSVLSFTIATVFDPNHLKRYLSYGLIGVVMSCLFGIYQYFGDLADLPGWLTGLSQNYMKGGIFPFPRIQSTALEPLFFANYLLVPLALLVVSQLFTKLRSWPFSLLVLTVILLSLSRGAQVAAIIIVIVLIAIGLYRKRTMPALKVVATGLGATIITLACIGLGSFLYGDVYGVNKKPSVQHNIEEFTDQATNVNKGESAEGRALARKLAAMAVVENPLIGIGAGNYGYYANQQEPVKFPSSETIVNNETLEIAAEQGFIGLILILLFSLSLAKLAASFILSGSDRSLRLVALGLLVGLAGIAFQYQLFSTLYITHIWVYIGLLAGVTVGAKKVS